MTSDTFLKAVTYKQNELEMRFVLRINYINFCWFEQFIAVTVEFHHNKTVVDTIDSYFYLWIAHLEQCDIIDTGFLKVL